MRLFSYVVQHDYGHAPNPYHGVCTLAHCKSSEGKPWKGKNIVDRAKVGDWVVGTGGSHLDRSAGHGKLIYAIQVDDKFSLADYYADPHFQKKKRIQDGTYEQRQGDNLECCSSNHDGFVLISRQFYYYGGKAISIPRQFREHEKHPLEKKGPGYRCKFGQDFIERFVRWIEKKRMGRHGDPCGKPIFESKRMKRERCKSSC